MISARICSVLLLAAGAAANVAPASKLAVSRVALPDAAPKALALRGGEVTKELFVKSLVAVFGFYGLQMLLVPEMLIDMNFDFKPDLHHIFITRGTSAGILGSCYMLLKCMDTEAAYKARRTAHRAAPRTRHARGA
jgi:hypothetical protein